VIFGPRTVEHRGEVVSAVVLERYEHIYKHISTLARVYLTPNASSVPVESLFSVTGLIKNARRPPIAPFLLNKLTFVHDNYGKFFPLKK
jgi:hypothetical protein